MAEHTDREAGHEQHEAEVEEAAEVVGALVAQTGKVGALGEPGGEHWSESILRAG